MPVTLDENTVMPIGLVCSIAIGVISLVRSWDSKDADQSTNIQVLTGRVDRLETRMDKSDERWDRILSELVDIKTRLGLVEVIESRPKK